MKIKKFMLWFILMLTAGCTQGTETVTTPPSETPSRGIGSLTAAPSFTTFPTDSPTSTSLPTMISTLPVEEARARLLDLLANNGDCRFPCLWGFTPGEDTVEDFRNFLNQFGEYDSPDNFYSDIYWFDGGSQSFFGLWEENIKMDTLLEHNGSINLDNLSLNAQGPRFESSPPFSPLIKVYEYYLLPQVLENYGQPSQIIIGPYPFDPDIPDQWLPMNVGLFYPEQGFYIEYILTKKTMGKYFIACPAEVTEFSIVVWDPMEAKTY